MGKRSQLLTYSQVAHELGVHYDTVRSWVARGDIPAVYIGRRLPRIERRELEAWQAARIRTHVPRREVSA